jgi:hypothetical protein
MRWFGLAKAGLQVRLAAMAYTLRHTPAHGYSAACFGSLMQEEAARIVPCAP